MKTHVFVLLYHNIFILHQWYHPNFFYGNPYILHYIMDSERRLDDKNLEALSKIWKLI